MSISDPYTNQDVRTTASPTFVDVSTTSILASSLASLAYVESTQVDATYGNFGSLASMANLNVVTLNGNNVPTLTTYDSGWFACANGGTYPKTHNLGTLNVMWDLQFSTDASGASLVACNLDFRNGEAGEQGGQIQAVTTTDLIVQAGGTKVAVTLDSSGLWNTRHDSGYYRVLGLAID